MLTLHFKNNGPGFKRLFLDDVEVGDAQHHRPASDHRTHYWSARLDQGPYAEAPRHFTADLLQDLRTDLERVLGQNLEITCEGGAT